MNTVSTSGRPDAIAFKASAVLAEKKDLDLGIQLPKKALFSEEGSAVLSAGSTFLNERPITGTSRELLWAWRLASCDFGNDCSDDSDIVLTTCAYRACLVNADLYRPIEYPLSSQDFTRSLAISARIKQEIRARNFQALYNGEYATGR